MDYHPSEARVVYQEPNVVRLILRKASEASLSSLAHEVSFITSVGSVLVP